MNIQVMSRDKAIQYCQQPHSNKVIIISISNPLEKYNDFLVSEENFNGVIAILEVKFFDIDDKYPFKDSQYFMTKKDAKKIASFVQQYRDKDIIVHCDFGVSRSSGVAAALSKFYNGTDDYFFDNKNFVPNMYCYTLMLEELFGSIVET